MPNGESNEKQCLIDEAIYLRGRNIKVRFSSGETFVLNMTKVSTTGYYPGHPPSLTDMEKFRKVEVSPHKGHLGWPEGYFRWVEGSITPIFFGADDLFFWGSRFSEHVPFDPTVLYFLRAFAVGRKLTAETLDRLKGENAPKSFISRLSRFTNEICPTPKYFLSLINQQTKSSKGTNYMGLLEEHLAYVDNFKDITFLFAHSAQLPSSFYHEPIYVLFKRDSLMYEVHGEIIDSCDALVTNEWEPVETTRQELINGIESRTIGWIEGQDFFASDLLNIVKQL